METQPFVVTLDGPAGVGKTTLARTLAEALGIAYLDTGAMFRTIALKLGAGAEALPEETLRERASAFAFTLEGCGKDSTLCCQGVAIGSEIRTEEVAALASRIATVPAVREILKSMQRSLGATTSLVAEGRDMGTVVFPAADCKVFLDARPEVRAKRRLGDLERMGKKADFDLLLKQIKERDDLDRNRPVAPLKAAEDASVIDTSDRGLDETLDAILSAVLQKASLPPLPKLLAASRRERALVHFITNYVTVNDCANVTLAAGGSPVMADDPNEAPDMVAHARALVLNMGTPSEKTVEAMRYAGMRANALGKPVVFDPVGAGATPYRNWIALELLKSVRMSVIKGNASEIKFLASGVGSTRGVDAAREDFVGEAGLGSCSRMAMGLAQKTGAVVVVTGAIDVVASQEKAVALWGGHPMMDAMSGSGCMGGAVIGAVLGATPDSPFDAALAAMALMALAGERAFDAKAPCGISTYRMRLIDEVGLVEPKDLARKSLCVKTIL